MAKKKKPEAVSLGITSVRRSTAAIGAKGQKRKTFGFTAAEASGAFSKGGASFTRWVATEKGIQPEHLMTEKEWAPLIAEFAARPIHGHRRTAVGGNHRINKAHRR